MTCKNFPKERNPRNTQQRQELGWSCGTHPQSQETRSFSVFILHVQFSHLRHNLGESAIGDKNFVWEVKLMSDIIHVSKSCGRTEFLGETLCICPPYCYSLSLNSYSQIFKNISTHAACLSEKLFQKLFYKQFQERLSNRYSVMCLSFQNESIIPAEIHVPAAQALLPALRSFRETWI